MDNNLHIDFENLKNVAMYDLLDHLEVFVSSW
jgi:hypothetical protein